MLTRLVRTCLAIVIAGSILSIATPAQATSCITGSEIRFNGPTGKYGVKGLIDITEPASLPCGPGGGTPDRMIGVQLFKNATHFVYFGWFHRPGCTIHDQTCFRWFFDWQDGTTTQPLAMGNAGLTCFHYEDQAFFNIRSETAGVFTGTMSCIGGGSAVFYTTPHLSFSTGRATVEIDTLGDTSANGVISKLQQLSVLGGVQHDWPSPPVCAVDTVIGWDGNGTLHNDGGYFSTINVGQFDNNGC
jgi:hypothetical protein